MPVVNETILCPFKNIKFIIHNLQILVNIGLNKPFISSFDIGQISITMTEPQYDGSTGKCRTVNSKKPVVGL